MNRSLLAHAAITIMALLLPAICAAESSVQSEIIQSKLNKCIEQNQTTSGQVECYSLYADSLDKAMSTVYKSITNRLKPDLKKKFKEAQRAWIQFRDRENESMLSLFIQIKGTIRQQSAASQLYSMNEKRLIDFEKIQGVLEELE